MQQKCYRSDACFLWVWASFGACWSYHLLSGILAKPPLFLGPVIYSLLTLMAVVIGGLYYLAWQNTRRGWFPKPEDTCDS